MIITDEISLSCFPFWGPAVDNAEELTEKEMDMVEAILVDLYPDGMREVDVNDLFAYEFEVVCGWIGKEIDNV